MPIGSTATATKSSASTTKSSSSDSSDSDSVSGDDDSSLSSDSGSDSPSENDKDQPVKVAGSVPATSTKVSEAHMALSIACFFSTRLKVFRPVEKFFDRCKNFWTGAKTFCPVKNIFRI